MPEQITGECQTCGQPMEERPVQSEGPLKTPFEERQIHFVCVNPDCPEGRNAAAE